MHNPAGSHAGKVTGRAATNLKIMVGLAVLSQAAVMLRHRSKVVMMQLIQHVKLNLVQLTMAFQCKRHLAVQEFRVQYERTCILSEKSTDH